MFKNFRKLDVKEEQELELLGSQLANLSSEMTFGEEQKARLKSNLFQAIENGETDMPPAMTLPVDLCVLGKNISSVTKGNYLSSYQKHLIWQELRSSIENKVPEKESIFTWFNRTWRAGLASFLIGVISLSIFALAPLDLRLTRAAKWTFLESVSGKVFVNRNGQIFSVDKNFNLLEGDLLFTGEESFVTIRFLDDSVARLGADTSLAINKLYSKPENSVSTQVELSLANGQIWASVYNLVDNDSRFVVETDNARAKVDTRAAFEMKTNKQTTTLAVYDNVVDFSKKTTSFDLVQPVISGYKAQVNTVSNFQIAYNDNDIVLQKNSGAIDQWAEMNISLDLEHEDVLKKENSQFIDSSVASGNGAIGALASFKDTTKKLFENTEIEQARQKFLVAELGIIKAEQLILNSNQSNDNRHRATPLMFQYKGVIQEILADYDNLKTQDTEQADRLIAEMKESVAAENKSLTLILPNDKLYDVKIVVGEASGYFVRNDQDRAEYLLAQARTKLFEVDSMVGKHDLKGADVAFQAYLSDLDELVAQVNLVNQAESGLFDLLDEQIKQFKVINSINKKLLGVSDSHLASLVTKVSKTSLNKLISIMQTYKKNGIPFNMLLDLNNTVESYFAVSLTRTEALLAMQEMMKTYPEYAEMQKNNSPNLENVTSTEEAIVDFNASQDISIDNISDLPKV